MVRKHCSFLGPFVVKTITGIQSYNMFLAVIYVKSKEVEPKFGVNYGQKVIFGWFLWPFSVQLFYKLTCPLKNPLESVLGSK
jgi:hypothetical protein